jgi:hypothetical protein
MNSDFLVLGILHGVQGTFILLTVQNPQNQKLQLSFISFIFHNYRFRPLLGYF